MTKKTICSIVGARPQFIKAATISRAFRKHTKIDEKIIHTGQHYDANMSDIFFDGLGIPTPSYQMHHGNLTHGQMTGRMIESLEEVFLKEQPDAILIYGDTNSTLAGAIAAIEIDIPVIHIEAGLRSYNRKMPEEMNRILSDQVSDLLFCPTKTAVENLKNEGISAGVHMVGDVMHDATLYAIEQTRGKNELLKKLDLIDKPYGVCTLHRAENTNNEHRFKKLIAFLEEQAQERKIIFPVHPRTHKIMAERGLAPRGVTQIDPLDYFELAELLANCELVLTDSGGLQKEAYFHRKPCITLRDETEWVETITSGWNRLWTVPEWRGDRDNIVDYGLGNAAEITVQLIAEHLNK